MHLMSIYLSDLALGKIYLNEEFVPHVPMGTLVLTELCLILLRHCRHGHGPGREVQQVVQYGVTGSTFRSGENLLHLGDCYWPYVMLKSLRSS